MQANSEVSALLGRIPSAVGYQPTLATDLGTLQERITTTKKGSITSVQVLVVLWVPSRSSQHIQSLRAAMFIGSCSLIGASVCSADILMLVALAFSLPIA